MIKLPTIESITLKKWIAISSLIMGTLLLLNIFTYAFLNQTIYQQQTELTELTTELTELTELSKLVPNFDIGNINRNLANIWLSNLDENGINFFEKETQHVGACWTHPISNKIGTLKLTVAPTWLSFEYPEGFQLLFSTKRKVHCYYLKEKTTGGTLWELVDECNELCSGTSFVNRENIVRGSKDVQKEKNPQI